MVPGVFIYQLSSCSFHFFVIPNQGGVGEKLEIVLWRVVARYGGSELRLQSGSQVN